MKTLMVLVVLVGVFLGGSSAKADGFMLLPNGCSALINAQHPVNGEPKTSDNLWACVVDSEASQVICLRVASKKDLAATHQLFQRNHNPNANGRVLAIVLSATHLDPKGETFPLGTMTFESPRESLILQPGKRDSKVRPSYLLRSEAFVPVSDSRYGHFVKVCTGNTEPMSKEIEEIVYKELAAMK